MHHHLPTQLPGHGRRTKNLFAVGLALLSLAGAITSSSVWAVIPATLNYQGFLTTKTTGAPLSSTVSVTFKLYDALTAGNLLYTEIQPTVVVTSGVFNAQIGSVTAFPVTLAFDKAYWLEVTVGSDTLTPRQPLASSATALRASVADSLAAVPGTGTGNTALGTGSMQYNFDGAYNTAVGLSSLRYNTGGGGGTAFGAQALQSNTTGGSNTAIGAVALVLNTTGYGNTAVGFNSLTSNIAGSGNIAVGQNAGLNLTGSNNIDIGNAGVAGESGIIRLGTAGTQSATYLAGRVNISPPDVIDFGSATRQMINLWGGTYGIGVQTSTGYSRIDADAGLGGGFAWYRGGVHSDTAFDPGSGGTTLMTLDRAGNLRTTGNLTATGSAMMASANVLGNLSASGNLGVGGSVTTLGNVTVSSPGVLDFGSTKRQMIDLSGGQSGGAHGYGIGIQSVAQYSRIALEPSNNGGFYWYMGGAHSDAVGDPGVGGSTLMNLNRFGYLFTNGYYYLSDRNVKQDFAEVDPLGVLEAVVALPISRWSYKNSPGVRHVGPMAQDFYARFSVGSDDKHISTADAEGVALAAIKGLNQKLETLVKAQAERIAALEQQSAEIEELRRSVKLLLSRERLNTPVALMH